MAEDKKFTFDKETLEAQHEKVKDLIEADRKTIEENAFESCRNLETVVFSEGTIETIGKEAFRFCTEIKEISFCDIVSVGDSAFYSCSKLAAVHFTDGLKEIGESAFAQTLVTDPVLPDSVQKVGRDAFYDYYGRAAEDAPEKLIIGNSLEEIGARAFGCSRAAAYEVGENNAVYRSVNGFLTDKGKNILIACPAGMTGEAYVPEGITAIGDYAFAEPNNLSMIHIPDTVEYIGSVNFERERIEAGEGGAEVSYRYKVTICSPADSYAHRYAMDRNIPWIPELSSEKPEG